MFYPQRNFQHLPSGVCFQSDVIQDRENIIRGFYEDNNSLVHYALGFYPKSECVEV